MNEPRQLGRSGIKVLPFALGGNVFGWSADEKTSFALLDALVEAGPTLIDTADKYMAGQPGMLGGESETVIGRWLKRSGKRARIVLASKVGRLPARPGLSADNIQAAAADSLQRLNTDYIDLYQAHEDDLAVPLEETLAAFGRLIERGQVRAIGASNYSAARLAEALRISALHHLPRYETLQPQYNLYDRAGYETALEPLAQAHGLGVLGYYALAAGFLTGKYRRPADVIKSSVRGKHVSKLYLNPRGLRILSALDDIAASHAATAAQVALAWMIARPSITAPIASATSVEQLHELLAALRLSLSAQQIADLDAASDEAPLAAAG
jgi:aryl-alcohol dehydrogenase-like predicted oxidoreductase